ncbi:extracellular solute-binding protein [Neobacillus muris]|uniref:extracellular solute-binding protein n=1 Tax=Neobacillus muris TaxID=2941334 RepID=UPI00204114AD|nr:extracellular solute-binding protein [Neobacillus muris]
MAQYKKFGKILAAGTLLASALVLGACGKEDEQASGKKTDTGKVDLHAKADISWSPILYVATAPTEVVTQKIEEATNTNLTFNWIPDATKDERMIAAIASGDMTDIVSLPTTLTTNSSVRQALKSGVFWEVSKYLDDYPNLKKISEDRREAASIEGNLYGVPFQKDFARGGLLIRKDWLDNLGLKVPTNLDELYEVAKAFTEDDPDGNGKDDTFGWSDRNELRYGSFKTLASYFGVPNGWAVDKNGKFTPEHETKEYKETMDYSRKLYKNGYLDKDFAVTSKDDQLQKFAQGKAGIYAGLISITQLKNMASGINNKIEIVPQNKIAGPDGEYRIWSEGNGVNGLLAFPKSAVKTEAELKRVLQFVNDMMNEDVFMLMTGGIKETHYTIDENGAYKILDNPLWQKDVQGFSGSRPSEITYKLKDADPDKQLVNDMISENDEISIMDPTVPLESATATERGTELQKIIIDATIKYIMGEIDEKGFDAEVKKWKESGGDQMKKEYEEAYKKANKK